MRVALAAMQGFAWLSSARNVRTVLQRPVTVTAEGRLSELLHGLVPPAT